MDYNRRLEALCKSKGLAFIPKNPRALLDKLGEVEPKVADRISRQDFKCPLFILGSIV